MAETNSHSDLHSRSGSKRCVFVSPTGKTCNCYAITGSEFCFNHAPEKADERLAARKKGGSARQGRVIGLASNEQVVIQPVVVKTVADVLAIIERGVNDLLTLENSFARAKALTGLVTAALKAIDVGSIEERLAAIETRLDSEAKRT